MPGSNPPPPSLRKSWSKQLPTAATPSEKGLWAQRVFGHFSLCLEAISFPLSIALLRCLLPDLCSLLQHPWSARRALQPSPCTMLTLTRAPCLCPHEQMLHPWVHSWAVLCQMCKSTPLPLLLLRGCGLAALGWEREGRGGEVNEGEGRLRFLPLSLIARSDKVAPEPRSSGREASGKGLQNATGFARSSALGTWGFPRSQARVGNQVPVQ